MIKGFTRLSVSGLVIFCGDLCGVEQGEKDAAEGGLATGGVVPLLEGMDTSSSASGSNGYGWYLSGKRYVSVGGSEAKFGADGEVTVGGTEGVEEW